MTYLLKNVINNEQYKMESKKIHVPSLVLMIIGAIFALILTIVTYPCSIISLVMSITKRKINKTTYAIVINIIALVVAVVNSIMVAMMIISKM